VQAWLVPHTHWDREWYRPFQDFRARLVDTVDLVLDMLAADPQWSFTLDGQVVVAEDYLQVRPGRRDELRSRVTEGRLGLGPWWVQPDSFLPAGETHVRNLLEGRRVALELGGCSTVAHLPDSFGHPASLPTLFIGFGLELFTCWRGHGDELDELPATWRWLAPDGSVIDAHHLSEGYFGAACLDSEDFPTALARVAEVARRLEKRGPGEPILLLNGIDHMLPDSSGPAVAQALHDTHGWDVRIGRLDDFARALPRAAGPLWSGELSGARIANLLPGVWSSRLPVKLAARRCEAVLLGWAEPLAALSLLQGAEDERPALHAAWRDVLLGAAHDSIGGCSIDLVHEQGLSRYADAEGLAQGTARRLRERLAGLAVGRRTPDSLELDVAAWNPSPRRRTDVLTLPLDAYPPIRNHTDGGSVHPLVVDSFGPRGFTVDGRPARLVASGDPLRMKLLPGQQAWDLQAVVEDLPALGWRRLRIAPCEVAPDVIDAGRRIEATGTVVEVADDGTFYVGIAGSNGTGLFAVQDLGDRGDTYDTDPIDDADRCRTVHVDVERRRHAATGIQTLRVVRTLELPAALTPARDRRNDELVRIHLVVQARVAPGVDRVDLDVSVTGGAQDHRLRLLLPGGTQASTCSAGTFATVQRTRPAQATGPAGPSSSGWKHPPHSTFCQQGWVRCGPLVVVAPGLPEAEVLGDGTVALTLLRAVGWLSQLSLTTRPEPAGPGMPTPGAQVPGGVQATLSLLPWDGADPSARSQEAELGFEGGWAGPWCACATPPTVP
jgi:mannosylglycerate hydrolase